MPDMSKHEDEACAMLQKAYKLIETCKHEVALLGALAGDLSWDAKDGFDGAADGLSEAESSIGQALHQIEQANEEPDPDAEHRKDFVANLGLKYGHAAE